MGKYDDLPKKQVLLIMRELMNTEGYKYLVYHFSSKAAEKIEDGRKITGKNNDKLYTYRDICFLEAELLEMFMKEPHNVLNKFDTIVDTITYESEIAATDKQYNDYMKKVS